jgi:hypothetical protein
MGRRARKSRLPLAMAFGSDRKGKISVEIYAAAIALAFLDPWRIACYVGVARIWLVPDRGVKHELLSVHPAKDGAEHSPTGA